MSATDERAYLYYQIANIALGSQDKARALQLAEDAANYVSKAENGLGKLRALIGLAGLYSKVDVARSFELLSEAAKVADRIGDYSPEQARLVRTLSNRNGSNNMVRRRLSRHSTLEKRLPSSRRLTSTARLDWQTRLKRKH